MAFTMETGIGGVSAAANGLLLEQIDRRLSPGTSFPIQLAVPLILGSAGAAGDVFLGRLAPSGIANIAPQGIVKGAYVSSVTTIGWMLSRRYL